ncbi:arylesterase [Janthinobacterium sp. B9-8]|uniref:arylesterase n=1 Tax=Janthinobacterium sp. B9-8 TaxID=1236179 RepID=UPI00061D0AF3|nr:arylesterase [Janthinobacterium sp. B9-8]AMC34993.1 arylesterase [Janthinobacterium sp. B9-8]
MWRFVSVLGFSVCMASAQAAAPLILVFGDSLSAGYGIAASAAWPALLDKDLAKQGKAWRVVNASVSGETTAGGLTRFPQALKTHQPKMVLLQLGANDGLRGLPLADMEKNLASMIKLAKASGAKVHLIGMQMPPNYGASYTQGFAAIYPRLAKQYSISLTPFLLAPVIKNTTLFQADQLHPKAEAQPLLMKMVEKDMGV